MRKDFEIKIKQFGEEQQKVKGDYIEILRKSEEQNRRIKVLELQEKVASLFNNQNYQRALEYANIALELDPVNTILLSQKAFCLWKLNDLPEACLVFGKIIEIEPNNQSAIQNLLELYLLSKRIDDFKALYNKNKSWIDSTNESTIKTYFELLQSYQQEDYERMKEIMEEYLEKISVDKKQRTTWDFSDVLKFLESRPDDKRKKLLNIHIELSKGVLDRDEARKRIIEL